MSFKLRDTLEPAYDGGLLDNKFVTAGLFIVKTKAQRNSTITSLYRKLDGSTTTMCYVDGDNMYRLINNPTTETTNDGDWEAVSAGTFEALHPLGNWQGVSNDPFLQDTDAAAEPNGFYIITGAPTPVDVTHAGLFEGATTQISDGWWTVSQGDKWFVAKNSTSWDALDKPQVIIDYENGIVIYHTHAIADVDGLQTALNEKLDQSNVTPPNSFLVEVSDDKIPDVLFLKTNYYDKTDTYNKNEVDALVGLNTSTAFDSNRPITKIPEVGQIPGGDDIQEFNEFAFYGDMPSTVVIDSIDPVQIGETISPTIHAIVERKGADFIQSISIYDENNNFVGSPPFTGTDPEIYIDFQVNTPITATEVPSTSYTIVIESSTNSVVTQITSDASDVISVYPFLYGSGATGLSDTDKYNVLNPLIIEDDNLTLVLNSNSNKLYFCMPEDYPNRVEIMDDAGGQVLGSLFSEAPVIAPVTSVGLAVNWTKNYKVYEANYNTDSSNVALSFVLDREKAFNLENNLDEINEGIVNKHLTKTLKDKLVNWKPADYLSKATYDGNDDGIVGNAAQLAFTGKNVTGSVIPAFTLVTPVGVDAAVLTVEVILADKDLGEAAFGITLESIPVGGTGKVMRDGAALPIDTTGTSYGDVVYLSSNGLFTFTRPATGLIQPAGAVLLENSATGALLINPVEPGDIYSSIQDWQPLTQYEKDVILAVPSASISGLLPGYILSVRPVASYTSGNSALDDYNAGFIEIVSGDMFRPIYDPANRQLDAFDMDSMLDGLTEVDPAVRKVTVTEDERQKLRDLQPSTYKGTFADPTALRAAFPEASNGDSADVVSTSTTWSWSDAAPPTPPTIGGDWVDTLVGSGGDMKAANYDPAGKAATVYDVDNHDSGVTNKVYTATEQTKLAGIEAGATADQSAAEIKTAYESNADTNAFTNADQTKLGGIEPNATIDQSAAEVPYDNAGSGLTATQVQAGIDELKTNQDAIQANYLDKATYDTNDNGIVDAANVTVATAVNDEAVNMNAGDIVYIDSTDVTSPKAKLSANNDPTTLPVSGIVLNDGATTSFAPAAVIKIGLTGVFQIPTFGAYSAGDSLWLGLAGQIVTTQPTTAPGITTVLVAYVSGIVAGDSFIEMINFQAFSSAGSSFDPSTSILASTSVQDALVEVGVRTERVMGTLSHDVPGGTTITAGEVALAATLSGLASNVTSPANGRLAVTANSDVTVQAHLSVDATVNNSQTRFELAVNGTGTGIFCSIQNGGNQDSEATVSMSYTLSLAATDYVSVLQTGANVTLYSQQITIHGNKT